MPTPTSSPLCSPGTYVPTTNTAPGASGGTVTLAANGLNEAYGYDSFGNLQQSGNFNFVQAYTANNRVSGFSYDAAGNMLSDGLLNNLVYDANGLVSWDSGTRYFYDPMGQRVGKAGFTATDTVYFGGRALARLTNGAWTDLVYGVDGGLLAEVPGTQNGAPVYRMTDHLGSSVGLLSASGGLMGAQETVPFGQLLPGGGAQETLVPFAQLEHDPESGLDHATYRQYASAAGRWMSPDPYDGSMSFGNPQSLNRYSYVGNNPLGFTDPLGLDKRGGGNFGACGNAVESRGKDVGADVGCLGEVLNIANDIESLFYHPSFGGSTVPRPPWDWHNIQLGQPPNIGQVLDLPGGCEFGACGGGDYFQDGQGGTGGSRTPYIDPDQARLLALATGINKGAGALNDPKLYAYWYGGSVLVATGGVVAADAAAGAEGSILFGRGYYGWTGYLNGNSPWGSALRVGFGWNGTRQVFRISGDLIDSVKKSGHIDWPW